MHALLTERLKLRTVQMDDAPAVQELASAREIAATTLNLPHPYPPNGAATWIQHARQIEGAANHAFAILRREDETLVGIIGIHADLDHHNAEVGYWIGLPYWNQGYATEALRRVLAFGFDEMTLNRIYGRHFASNTASCRVMDKVGMTYEGTLRQHILKWGDYVDVDIRAILREEWD